MGTFVTHDVNYAVEAPLATPTPRELCAKGIQGKLHKGC